MSASHESRHSWNEAIVLEAIGVPAVIIFSPYVTHLRFMPKCIGPDLVVDAVAAALARVSEWCDTRISYIPSMVPAASSLEVPSTGPM